MMVIFCKGLVESCGFPPFREKAAEGWGTRHQAMNFGDRTLVFE